MTKSDLDYDGELVAKAKRAYELLKQKVIDAGLPKSEIEKIEKEAYDYFERPLAPEERRLISDDVRERAYACLMKPINIFRNK